MYACGARVSEVGIQIEDLEAIQLKNKSVRISRPLTRKPRRRMFRRLQCAVEGFAPLCMDTNDPETVVNGFLKRLLRTVPVPKPDLLEELKQFNKSLCERLIPRIEVGSFKDWLDGTKFNDARKAELQLAHDNLQGGPPSKRQRAHVDSFPKSEAYIIPDLNWKNCRLINSRCDAFKVYVAPAFKAIEDAVYSLRPFIKHTPVRDRPALVSSLKQPGRKFYATDYTAYESHFTAEVMRALECTLYEHCLANYPELSRCITKTLTGVNKMRTRTGISASVEARRMSGEMCTSLGNGWSNYVTTLFLITKKGGDYDGFVEGDDGLFSSTVELTAKDYEDLGFTIKIEEVRDPCRASFCGMIFSDAGNIIRDPRSFLCKFGWTSSFINGGQTLMDQLLHAKALSTLCETPQCPIVAKLAWHALKMTKHTSPRFVDDGYHTIPDYDCLTAFNPPPETRQLFAEVYGVSLEEQLYIEGLIDGGHLDQIQNVLPPPPAITQYIRSYLELG